MTLEQLQAKRDEILKAIGIARVIFADRSVEYTADKEKELAVIDAEIARLQSPQARQFTVQTSRGLEP